MKNSSLIQYNISDIYETIDRLLLDIRLMREDLNFKVRESLVDKTFLHWFLIVPVFKKIKTIDDIEKLLNYKGLMDRFSIQDCIDSYLIDEEEYLEKWIKTLDNKYDLQIHPISDIMYISLDDLHKLTKISEIVKENDVKIPIEALELFRDFGLENELMHYSWYI